jgi:hypothetical protein
MRQSGDGLSESLARNKDGIGSYGQGITLLADVQYARCMPHELKLWYPDFF